MYKSYNAAQYSSLVERPKSSRIHENEVLKNDYYSILDRSYSLGRNNSIASAVRETMVDYLASTGLTPIATDPVAQEVWDMWAENAHINGVDSINDVYRTIISAQVESGDVLLTTPIEKRVGSNKINTRIDIIHGGRIKTPNEFLKDNKDDEGNTVYLGVAYNGGREVGYWVIKNGNNGHALEDYDYISKFDPKTNRLNAYLMRRPDSKRPNQARSLPMITSVMNEVEDIASLWDSSIWASQNHANLSVILKSNQPGDIQSALGGVTADGDLNERTDNLGNLSVVGEIPMGGGVMTAPADTDVSVLSPTGNIDRDALFMRSNRYLCASIGIPMEVLFKDFSKVNFSSSKMAMDSFFRKTKYWTKCNAKVFTILYRMLNVEASLKGIGVKKLTPENAKTILNVTWVGPQTFVDSDPTKNSKAETERIGNNITSSSKELASRGENYEDIVRSKAKEVQIEDQIAQEMGVDVSRLRPQNSNSTKNVQEIDDE